MKGLFYGAGRCCLLVQPAVFPAFLTLSQTWGHRRRRRVSISISYEQASATSQTAASSTGSSSWTTTAMCRCAALIPLCNPNALQSVRREHATGTRTRHSVQHWHTRPSGCILVQPALSAGTVRCLQVHLNQAYRLPNTRVPMQDVLPAGDRRRRWHQRGGRLRCRRPV